MPEVERIEAEVSRRYPVMAGKARSGRSRREAIRAFCIACMGGSRSLAARCEASECFLHPYRPGTSGQPRRVWSSRSRIDAGSESGYRDL